MESSCRSYMTLLIRTMIHILRRHFRACYCWKTTWGQWSRPVWTYHGSHDWGLVNWVFLCLWFSCKTRTFCAIRTWDIKTCVCVIISFIYICWWHHVQVSSNKGERGYKPVELLLSQHASTQFRTGLHNYSRTRSYDTPACIQLFQHTIVSQHR